MGKIITPAIEQSREKTKTPENPYVPVSVVIPCFRCAKTIGRAVASVSRQTQKPSEVVLVDDASDDDTLTVLQEIENQYSGWIKVISLKVNTGAATARNAGWLATTQPYIAFLDADDSWHFDKLRIQYEYMQNNQDVALSGHQCVLFHDSQNLPTLPIRFYATKINAISLLFKNSFATPTVMLKCDIQFRFQNGKRCAEDLLLWQQIAFGGLKVMRIESPLAYVHKPYYGASGLSAQLWEMEFGELNNFVTIYRAGKINFLWYAAATLFSLIKFSKRLLGTNLRGS